MTDEASSNANVAGQAHDLTISPKKMGSGSQLWPAPSVGIVPGETSNTLGSRERSPLVFAINHLKGKYPGYLSLDKALEQYGAMRFPDKWGRLPNWQHMPFHWDDKIEAYLHHRIGITGSKKGSRISTILKLEESLAGDAIECARLYLEVWHSFRDALRKRHIRLYGLHPILGKRIPVTDIGLFTVKYIDVFYTGSAVLEYPLGALYRCRLFVRKTEFKTWIAHYIIDDLIAILKALIEDKALSRDYQITRVMWKKVLLPSFGIYGRGQLSKIIERRLFINLSVRQQKGRSFKGSKKSFDQHKAELLTAIEPVIRRFHGVPGGKPDRPENANSIT